LIFIPGWLASNEDTRAFSASSAGLGPVVTSHIVAVAPEPEALPLGVLLLLPELLHAATMVAIAAAAATARAARLLCMVFISPRG
jgi:hypothetical protein